MYADDFKSAVRETIQSLEDLWQSTIDLVNATLDKVQIQMPDNKPWEIVGIAPQIVGKHDRFRKGGKLVKLNQL